MTAFLWGVLRGVGIVLAAVLVTALMVACGREEPDTPQHRACVIYQEHAIGMEHDAAVDYCLDNPVEDRSHSSW